MRRSQQRLPPSLRDFLETLGIAQRPEKGNYDFKDKEPDF